MNIKWFFLLLMLAFAGISLPSCQSAATAQINKTDSVVPVKSTGVESLDQFLSGFEKAVLAHKSSEVLNCLDKDYKKEQYEKQMKFNTDSFLNAFFSNYQMEKTTYKIIFKNITKMTRTESMMVSGNYTVTYMVWTGSVSQTLVLTVFTRLDKGEVKHAIYGPVSS